MINENEKMTLKLRFAMAIGVLIGWNSIIWVIYMFSLAYNDYDKNSDNWKGYWMLLSPLALAGLIIFFFVSMAKNKKDTNMKEHYKVRLAEMSDKELIDDFNKGVDSGQISWRGAPYLRALCEELEHRNYGYSDIGIENGLSIKKRVKLINSKVVVDE